MREWASRRVCGPGYRPYAGRKNRLFFDSSDRLGCAKVGRNSGLRIRMI